MGSRVTTLLSVVSKANGRVAAAAHLHDSVANSVSAPQSTTVRMVDSTCVLYVLYLPQSPKLMIAVNSSNRAICKTAQEILYTRKKWVRRLCENPRSIITIASETCDTWVVQYVQCPALDPTRTRTCISHTFSRAGGIVKKDHPAIHLRNRVSPGPSLNTTREN
jgi:hypothetical protein